MNKAVAMDEVTQQGTKAAKPRWSRFRAGHLATFWFAIWPLLTIVLGACYARNAPNTKSVPLGTALAGAAGGILYLLPEFIASAVILFLMSWIVFALFPAADANRRKTMLFEPLVAFFGLSLGISLEFPAILNNSIFTPIQSLSLVAGWGVLFGFLLIAAVLRNGLQSRKLVRVIGPVLAFVALGWGLTQVPVSGRAKEVNKGSTVILGVDSMGLLSDIGHLYYFAQENGGSFYQRTVTPGLLTNAVWTAIFEHRPVHETGTTLIFQTPDWSRSPFQMVREAKKQGYQTWSYFTCQNTTYVGSLGGFDYDRSGPMGWLDNASVAAKNGSVFVSFVVSRLPKIPFSRFPQNQSGTYAYDLRTLIHNIFSDHDGTRPVLAIGHLGYLHNDVYPNLTQLTKAERRLLLTARIDSLKDAGTDWQILPVPGDRIDLRNWKYQNVQRVITDEITQTGFLNAQNKNRLVIMSDHGTRTGLTNENFGSETYYRVPLITFNLPVRDVLKPISLLDLSSIIGIEDPTSPGPADPMVEYINFDRLDEFVHEIGAAKWTADGRVTLRPETGKRVLAQLRSYAPYKQGDAQANQVAEHEKDVKSAKQQVTPSRANN